MPHLTRRQLAALFWAACLGPARAQARRDALAIGLDIIDAITFDPARQSSYTPPLVLDACYDTLVTMRPGHYDDVVPRAATQWERTPDGQGWRFTLDPAATFSTGNKVTPEDWRFTFDRLLALDGGPAQFLDNVASVAVSGANTFDIMLKQAAGPLLGVLAAAEYGVMEKAVVLAHGGVDQPGAGRDDGATEWLNQNSAGSGPYVLTGWAPRRRIQLAANPHAWRGAPGYQRVAISHMPDPTAQLRAVQRGDIDVAFNLIPEAVVALQSDTSVRVESTTGLDFVYLALNGDPARNKALSVREAREAIGYAIDYDGLLHDLLGDKAVRPASFLPIGVLGSTPEIAAELGFHQDLDRARALLDKAGLSGGFSFELSFGDGAIAGLTYQTLGRKLRADLARVGITANLKPTNPVGLRSEFLAGHAEAVIAFWSSPVVESRVWALAAVQRMAERIDAPAAPDLLRLIDDADSVGLDQGEQTGLWREYQRAMVEAANLVVLFQPTYQVGVSNKVADFELTGAGWLAELGAAHPAH